MICTSDLRLFFFSAFCLLHGRSVLVLQVLDWKVQWDTALFLCSGDTLYQISPLKNLRPGVWIVDGIPSVYKKEWSV
jgi:hypothetical protein